MPASHRSHSEYSEPSSSSSLAEQQRLPLARSRRKYVFHDEEKGGHTAVDVKLKWKSKDSQKRCDLDLFGVVFDFEGNMMDAVHVNNDRCPGVHFNRHAVSEKSTLHAQSLRISFGELHPLANVVMVFMSCAPGNELRDLSEGSSVDVWEHGTMTQNEKEEDLGDHIYSLSLKQNEKSLFSKSASMIACRFYKKDTGDQNWELLTIGQCCDIGVRYADLAELLVDHFPVIMKEEGMRTLKRRAKKQAMQKLNFTNEVFVDKDCVIDGEKGNAVAFCLGWDARYGHSRSMYYLDANAISYGRFGTKLDLVDNIAKQSRDGSTTINLEEYKHGNRTDEVVRVELDKVASNVNAIVFVAIAASSTMDSGFFKMSSPYMRLKHIDSKSDEHEIYRYAVPQKYMYEDAKEKSIVVAKLTRDHGEPTSWHLTPISEFSSGNHGVYDEVLIEQIDHHVDKMDLPDIEFLSAENPIQSLKNSNGIIVDFASMNSAQSVHVLQIGKYGKDVNITSRTFLPPEDAAESQPLFTLKIPTKQRSIARYRNLPYDFSELEENGIYTVLWVVSPYANVDESDSGENSLTIIDKSEKIDLCMCYFGAIQKPVVAMKLYRNDKNVWKLMYVGKDLTIPLRGQVSMLRFSRALRGHLKMNITTPEVRHMQPNEKFFVRKEDAYNLIVGLGIEGSTKNLLKTGKFVHHIRGEMELYDNFSEYHGVVYENRSVSKNCKAHNHHHLHLNTTADDEEQFSVKRATLARTRFFVVNLEPKTRALIQPDDQLYVRVCDGGSGKEVARISVKGKAFLSGYKEKQSSGTSNKTTIEDGFSDENSDGGSVDGSPVTMLVVKQTIDGWMLRSVAKAIPDPREYMDPQPKMLEVSIISAKNLVPADNGDHSDSYTKIKLTEKLRVKGLIKKKKQKFRTQVKKKTLDPVWNEKFEFKIFHSEDAFTIVVMDHDVESRVDVPVAVALASDGMEQELRLVRKNDLDCKSTILLKFKRIG